MKYTKAILLFAGLVGLVILNILLLFPRYGLRCLVENIQPATLPQIVRVAGVVQPKKILTIKAEFDGPVLTKSFREGDHVKRDQILMTVGRDKIQLEHQNKFIALKNATSDLAKSRREVKIQKSLYAKGAVAQSNVEDAERAVIHAEQALQTAKEDFRQAEERWNKNKIVAAFDGVILRDGVTDDVNVTNGHDLLTLADVSLYTVIAKVDELDIAQVKPGQKAQVTLQAFDGRTLGAVVTEIGSQAETTAVPEIPVTLMLNKEPGLTLKPNLSAIVNIVTGSLGNVLSVPLSAVTNAEGETRVWVVSRGNRLQPRAITLGPMNPDRAVVTSGLFPGDRVVIKPTPQFVKGKRVLIAPSLPLPSDKSSKKPAADRQR